MYTVTQVYIRAGWTTDGGVWIWKTAIGEANKKGRATLQNTSMMDERCELIEKLCGVCYTDPKACPYLNLPWWRSRSFMVQGVCYPHLTVRKTDDHF
ncbi:hypothetical protein N7448_006716 [Penicillium atrosanguineum]|uniref:Uncharacterized protein n=1 Tax=Penicillium atrosanguineum TaxID=1132637 RepID=A0A9W9L1R9_9EURO|nr:Crossover junction endonuclease mus81 [Penicillium atrosanguineum]KAJ5132558.1 hypothetical protein N7448_006716 [Penicillium atrosanguineum]KAJ5137228.1 hypothetical protein N7526_003461 [Penicillium atrosanguineum]KAJ5290224.1 Crossover junction endonuclease mus81 [Penicillium atrosanguineum]KAJ5308048.1 hypothetical protein N7476_008704 [Penicillium atrosanguineum]